MILNRGNDMNTNGKTRPGAGTPERATETAAFGEATISCNHSTTAAADRQIKISDYLGHSQESAVTGRELCALTGLDHRTIRAQIEQERRAGARIVAGYNSRYWVTDDPAEAQRFARSMRHRAKEILRTARAIERGAGLD